MIRFLPASAAALFALTASNSAGAFSQKALSGTVPIGHEYLTIRGAQLTGLTEFNDTEAAVLANKYQRDMKRLTDDGTLEKMGWKLTGVSGFAQSWWQGLGTQSREEEIVRYSLNHAGSYVTGAGLNAFSAAMGQRWVDEMGFPQKQQPTPKSCFNVVGQEPEENMPDHFMRRGDQLVTNETAYNMAMARLRKYFAAAVNAPDELMPMRDGGLTGGYYYLVTKPYFLLGRALHLVQDSFSPEHTLRGTPPSTFVIDPPYYTENSKKGDYKKIIEIKDWDCSPDTFQHSHVKPKTMDQNGDMIWKGYGSREKTFGQTDNDLKPVAQAALEATKDLIAIFVRARAQFRQVQVAKVGQRGVTYDPGPDLQPFIQDWMTLDKGQILVPKKFVDPKIHRPDCAKLPNGALDVKARQKNEATRNKLRQACLTNDAASRLSSDPKDPDHNKPAFFWTGAPGDGTDAPTPVAHVQTRAKTTDDIGLKKTKPTLRRTQSTGDLKKN